MVGVFSRLLSCFDKNACRSGVSVVSPSVKRQGKDHNEDRELMLFGGRFIGVGGGRNE